MIAAVVVDVDDTVYLERDYVRSGFEAVGRWSAAVHGLDGVGEHAWGLFERGVRRTTLTDAFAAFGGTVDDDVRADLIRVYREHEPTIALLDDAEALLDALGGRLPLAVVTDGPAESQRAKCRALGLDRRIASIVVTAEHGSSKPDPAMFALAARGWDVPAGEIVYLADNPTKDFFGPAELGWRSIRIRRPGSLHVDLPTPSGVVEVEDLDDDRLWSELRGVVRR